MMKCLSGLEFLCSKYYSETKNFMKIMVDFEFIYTVLICPRELRFPTITELSRDSEIAPTCDVYNYFNNSP